MKTIQIADAEKEEICKTPHGRKVAVYGGYDNKTKSYGMDLETGKEIKNPDYLIYVEES